MREEKLKFSVIIRVFISLLPFLLGLPAISIIMCSYNISMSFIVFGPLTAVVSSLSAMCIAMFIGGLSSIGGETFGLALAIEASLASFGCIYGFLYKRKFSSGIILSSLGILLPSFVYLRHIASTNGLSIAQYVIPSVDDINLMFTQALSQIDFTLGNAEFVHYSAIINKTLTLLFPAALIIMSTLLAYVIMWCISVQTRKLPVGLYHSFSRIKMPRTLVIVFVLTMIVALCSDFININEDALSVVMNMYTVLFALCFLAGVSFVDFYLRKKVKSTILRILLYLAVLMIGVTGTYAPTLCVLVACIDSFANFRKIVSVETIRKGENDETKK